MHKSPQLVNITCNFNKTNQTFNAGDSIAGTIVIEPNYDLEIKSISYSICYTGKTKSKSTLITEKQVHSHRLTSVSKIWKKGEKYHYPFTKVVNQPISYNGELFDIEWFLKVYIIFTDDVKKISQEVALRTFDIKRVVFPSTNLTRSFSFKVLTGQKKTVTIGAQKVFKHKQHEAIFTLLITTSACAIIFNVKALLGLSIPIFEIIGSLSLILAVRHIILGFGKFEEFTFEVLRSQIGQSSFPVKFITNSKSNTIKYFQANYVVYENRHMNSSSSALTYESKKIYQMTNKIQKEVMGNETTLLIPFPRQTDIPVSLSDEDFQIEWQLEATIELNSGIKKEYQFSFLTSLE